LKPEIGTGPLHHPPPTITTASADARPVSRLGLVTRAWYLTNAVLENPMHQTISQRRAILEGLRQRAELATSEFYAIIQKDEPVRAFRYMVEPRGNNLFSIVDRNSGKPAGLRTGIQEACEFAQQLEETPPVVERQAVKVSTFQLFARRMTAWTVAFTGGLFAFAFFGS
jgi:hypothetical protein